MIPLNANYYRKLADELSKALYEKEQNEGVIELNVRIAKKQYAEVIFAYRALNLTIDKGFENICYLVIAILDGKRHSTDFDQHRFAIHFDN